MEYFVAHDSIVRKIWGRSDTVLFIFAGAAAQFSVNKAVDWLYFTGKLPADPIGRLFSTVTYAKQIIFLEKEKAHAAITRIKSIHTAVENARASVIPDWAYREVLFMLIHYSISSFELLERKLTLSEKDEVVHVFCEVGERMGIPQLPEDYKSWLVMHERQLKHNLEKSNYSVDLYKQYHKHLGSFRYAIMLQVQGAVAPREVTALLELRYSWFFKPILNAYKWCRKMKTETLLQSLLLPQAYKYQVLQLNYNENNSKE